MISVIVPTYNEEKNIERCLMALENQNISKDEYEIIVVDGHSKDRTVDIAKKHADKVILQKSKGVGGARNDGVSIAKGDIIATTDADCVAPPEWLEIILKNFDRDKNAVGIFGPIKPIEKKLKYKIFLFMNNTLAYILYQLRIMYLAVGANVAFKRKDFLAIGGYADYSAGDDYEMPLRLRKKGKILFDWKLFVHFSMRRYELFGTLNALYLWFSNAINDVFKLKKKITKYNKVDYN